ncbi:MAG: DUF169 domain-containing protein [Bacteroidales bacterium]|nr:DUF169 domain-containing protein [Bacteroidales bacterium]
MKDVKQLIDDLRQAFGEGMKLPIAVWYSDEAAGEEVALQHCMFAALPMVEQGQVVSFSKDKLHCGGGRVYSGFMPLNAGIPKFVSNVEHYKQTPEMVNEYVESLDIELQEKPYFNFARLDQMESLDGVEGLVFFGNADVISGLVAWAFYDTNEPDAVSCQFASGCCSMLTFITTENRKGGNRAFLGMYDLSVRKFLRPDEQALAIPLSRLVPMLETLHDCALFRSPAWTTVKERLQ